MLICLAAALEKARKPLTASGIFDREAWRTTQLPSFCSSFLPGEKYSILSVCRSAMTILALFWRIGLISLGMAFWGYWLSPSVLTMISAPLAKASSKPSLKDRARPLLLKCRTMWLTLSFLAT